MVRRSRNLSDAVDLAVIDKDAAIFAISVAAELAGMHPQTLRTYDRLGLCLLYTSPSPRDVEESRMPSSA